MSTHEPRYTGPLGPVELASDSLVAQHMVNAVSAAIQLVNKSLDALERGESTRAQAWLDRAERLLPDPDAVPQDHRDGVVEAREAIVRMRAMAADQGAQDRGA